MHFEAGKIYHIYNMGNSSRQVFFSDENYLYFLLKYRTEVSSHCETLAYCLMPNHFHFLILATEKSEEYLNRSKVQILSRKFGNLLSSYSQAINKQLQSNGSVFRQKTKSKSLSQFVTFPTRKHNYFLTCFLYIHQNPVVSGIVDKPEQWVFSSYPDYAGHRNGTLCNIKNTLELLNIDQNTFIYLNSKTIDPDEIKYIW
jgi:putative transposase